MSQARIIINVSDQEQVHSNGLSGTHLVPARGPKEEFGLLVVYPTAEIQDIGDQRRIRHWLKATPLAMDIVGLRSDAASTGPGSPASKEKWGILLCEAEPDLPKELIQAIEAEIDFLQENPPDVKMRKDGKTGAVVAVNIESETVAKQKWALSLKVQELRQEFEQECRKLVSKAEVARARKALLIEDQRMVAEGDRMWARPTEQQNINEPHRRSCARLGQERPWCYIPQQMVDCPGCGAKIKENVLTCSHCNGWLDEGIEPLRAMKPKERAVAMYPERYTEEPMAATGKKV